MTSGNLSEEPIVTGNREAAAAPGFHRRRVPIPQSRHSYPSGRFGGARFRWTKNASFAARVAMRPIP